MKGVFFHHFKSKEALAVAAADHWSQTTSALFADAPFHETADPLDRILAYIEFRKELVCGDIPDFTCLVGTMVQEAYAASEFIRDACWRWISGHAETLEADIQAAIVEHGVEGVDAKGLALFTQATIQGAFILAKAKDDAGVAIHCIRSFEALRRTSNSAQKQKGPKSMILHPPAETEPRELRLVVTIDATSRRRLALLDGAFAAEAMALPKAGGRRKSGSQSAPWRAHECRDGRT